MPLNIDWQQILLHLFNFVILYAILYFLLYKPVKQFIDNRTDYYKKLDEEANEKLLSASKAEDDHKRILLDVDNEIAAEKARAFKELEVSLAAKKKQAEDEAAKIVANAKRNADSERQQILREAQNEIADMVTTATARIIAGDTSDAFDRFLDVAQRGKDNE